MVTPINSDHHSTSMQAMSRIKDRFLHRAATSMYMLRSRKNKEIIRENLEHGILAVNICNHHGLGAKLVWALEILVHCDLHGLTPAFRFSYPSGGVEHFQPFFFIPQGDVETKRYARIRNVEDLKLGKYYGSELSLTLASSLLRKYLGIRPHVREEVDAFCRSEFGTDQVLGLHYRGTDKSNEAPPVAFARVLRNIEYYLKCHPETTKIFVASDDANFIRFIGSGVLDIPIVFRQDAFRSIDQAPVHHLHRNDIKMNRDAIVNCLILAKCQALMKTASILSAWSKLFNPSLPLIILSHPRKEFSWFPEKDLVAETLFDPVP